MGGLKWVPRCFTSTLHSWPQSPFSVTLSRDGLALESCESQSSVEELLLSPGGSRTFGSGGLALAWLANPPFLSATQPVPPATGPKPLFTLWLCWAQGFEPDFRRDRSRSPAWKHRGRCWAGLGNRPGWSWGATEQKSPVSDPENSPPLTAAGWHADTASGIGARYAGASFQPHPALRVTLGTLPAPSLRPQCVPSLSGPGPEGTMRVQRRKKLH